MKITKEFRVESAHIVRNCTSERCSHSVHGHSAVIEVILEGSKLDNAQMLYDFGLMKGPIKQWIDSMDHCYLLCNSDDPAFKDAIMKFSDRHIVLPFNPTAEMLSMFIMSNVNYILDHTRMANGESLDVRCTGVIYHETVTGKAQCSVEDCDHLYTPRAYDKRVLYSNGVTKDWSPELNKVMFPSENVWDRNNSIYNPVVQKQIDL